MCAVDRDSFWHPQAKSWIEERLSGPEPTLFPWPSILGFLRIVTRPGVLTRVVPLGEALEFVDAWLDSPPARTVAPGPGHWKLVRELLRTAGVAGNLTTDAHLAALAIENGAAVASFDRDFLRFPGVRLVVPGRD